MRRTLLKLAARFPASLYLPVLLVAACSRAPKATLGVIGAFLYGLASPTPALRYSLWRDRLRRRRWLLAKATLFDLAFPEREQELLGVLGDVRFAMTVITADRPSPTARGVVADELRRLLSGSTAVRGTAFLAVLSLVLDASQPLRAAVAVRANLHEAPSRMAHIGAFIRIRLQSPLTRPIASPHVADHPTAPKGEETHPPHA